MDFSRFAPYLGIVAALALGIVVLDFSSTMSVVRPPAPGARTASSTLAVLPSFTLPDISLPAISQVVEAVATTAPIQKKKIATSTSPVPVAPAAPVATSPAPESAPSASSGDSGLDAAATALRGALVNIICYVPFGSGLHSISGSGIIIDAKGVILTNAHIAQYFLLADRGASCTIRTGSPATDRYKAALMYLPPAWISANASVITQAQPSGTGEYDFALLAITKSATAASLPGAFSFVPLAVQPPGAGTPVVIASYGAQFLQSSQIQSALSPTIVFGSVKAVFTFATRTIDVLALGGSAAAQEGSSGGGVADASGSLVGTITTSTVEGSTDTRSLSAITASYIRSEYANETGEALDLLLARDPATAAAGFASRIPELESVLTAQLP